MNTKKLGFFYLPVLAILVTLVAITLELLYDGTVSVKAVIVLVLMSVILFLGIRMKAWK